MHLFVPRTVSRSGKKIPTPRPETEQLEKKSPSSGPLVSRWLWNKRQLNIRTYWISHISHRNLQWSVLWKEQSKRVRKQDIRWLADGYAGTISAHLESEPFQKHGVFSFGKIRLIRIFLGLPIPLIHSTLPHPHPPLKVQDTKRRAVRSVELGTDFEALFDLEPRHKSG